MKHYKTILFDLDGTLLDSGRGILNSVCYALTAMGIPLPEDESSLHSFIGPPLSLSFSTQYGLSPKETEEAIRLYRVYYVEKGMWECTVYPGVAELLPRLRQAGRRLLVATAKPEIFAVPLLEHFALAKDFDFIAGAPADGGVRSDKAAIIRYALAACGVTDPSSVLMVGDRKYDILGAAALGMDGLGVLYGYGSREELSRAGALALAEGTEDLYHFITTH